MNSRSTGAVRAEMLKSSVLLIFFMATTVRCEDYAEEPISLSLSEKVINKGEKLAVSCKANELKEPPTWQDPHGRDVPLTRPTRYHTEYIGGKDQNLLIIEKAEFDDAGNWTCRSGSFDKYFSLVVVQAADFHGMQSRITATEMSDVMLKCRAIGKPEPIIRWFRNNTEITSQTDPVKYHITSDNSLKIAKLNRNDAGEYKCQAWQSINLWVKDSYFDIMLYVRHKPVFVHEKVDFVYAIIGEPLSINCSAQAYPPPQYKWLKRRKSWDQEMIPDVTNMIATDKDGSYSILTIPIRSEDDLISYICRVSNDQGYDEYVFEVSRGNKPDPPDIVTLLEKNSTSLILNITCENCTNANADFPKPDNLPFTGYRIQVAPDQTDPDKPWIKPPEPDWDAALLYDFDIQENSTLFEIYGLNASTAYLVRVSSRNLAGFSEYTLPMTFITALATVLRVASHWIIIAVSICFSLK